MRTIDRSCSAQVQSRCVLCFELQQTWPVDAGRLLRGALCRFGRRAASGCNDRLDTCDLVEEVGFHEHAWVVAFTWFPRGTTRKIEHFTWDRGGFANEQWRRCCLGSSVQCDTSC